MDDPPHITRWWDSSENIETEQFPGFGQLSARLQWAILSRSNYISKYTHSDSDFKEDPILPTETHQIPLYLAYLNNGIIEYRGKNPTQAYYFLSCLYQKLEEIPDIKKSPEYLRFMSEWIAAVSNSADYSSWIQKTQEMENLIDQHIQRLFYSSDMSTFEEFKLSDNQIYLYRHTLLHLVENIAYFYSRIGNYEKAEKYISLWKLLSTKFSSAQTKFDLFILEISMMIDRWIYEWEDMDLALKNANLGLKQLDKIYHEKHPHLIERPKMKLRILEILLRVKKIEIGNIWEIANLMRERDELIKTSQNEDKQHLFHIEVLLYIAIEKLQNDDELMEQAMVTNPGSLQFVLNGQKKINKKGFNVDHYLNGGNARFFLWSLIELFEHMTMNLIANPKPLPQTQIQVCHMMLDIYNIAIWTGNRSINREIFKELPFYKQFMRCTHLLMEDLVIGTACSDEDILESIDGSLLQRQEEEHNDFHDARHFMSMKWTCDFLYSISVINNTCSIWKSKISIFQKSTWWKEHVYVLTGEMNQSYSILINADIDNQDKEEEMLRQVTDDIKELFPYIQKLISLSLLNRTSTILWWDEYTQLTSHETNEDIINLQEAITKMTNLRKGIQVDPEWSFSRIKQRNFLRENRSSIDHRTRISIDLINKDLIQKAIDNPIILTFPDKYHLSIVFASTLPNGTKRYIVRYGIEDINQMMPAFSGLSVLYIEVNWYIYSEDPKTIQSELLPLFKRQQYELIEKIWTRWEGKFEDRITNEYIHTDSIGHFLYKWTDAKWANILEVKAKYNDTHIQCDFTLYMDKNGDYIMYVGSMIRTWQDNPANTNAIFKWIATVLQWYLSDIDGKLVHANTLYIKLVRDSEHQWNEHNEEWKAPQFKQELLSRWIRLVSRSPENIPFSRSMRNATFRSYFFTDNRNRI